jgi:anti-sigma factor RsiW
MTIPQDHPTEKLRPLLMGELSEREATIVEAHVAICPDCRSEGRALEMLLSDVPEMDEVERARLRRGVAEALAGEAPPSPRRASRLAPALGVAATILLLVAGAVWVGTNLTGLDDAGEEAAPELTGEEAEPDQFGPEAREWLDDPDAPAREAAPAGEALQQTTGARTLMKDGPQPLFRSDVGDFGPPALRRLGTAGDEFRRFASAYHAAAATPTARRMFVESLAQQADDSSIRPQIRACAQEIISDPPGPLLPAYGATGSFEDRPALVLGFVHGVGPGPLDRFMLWVWPRGECAAVLYHEAGRIDY